MGVYESLEVDGANGKVTFTVSFFLLQWSDCRPGKSEVLPHCWHDWYALHVHICCVQVPYFFDQTPQLLFIFMLVFVWLLFEGGVYFIGKPTDINNC